MLRKVKILASIHNPVEKFKYFQHKPYYSSKTHLFLGVSSKDIGDVKTVTLDLIKKATGDGYLCVADSVFFQDLDMLCIQVKEH